MCVTTALYIGPKTSCLGGSTRARRNRRHTCLYTGVHTKQHTHARTHARTHERTSTHTHTSTGARTMHAQTHKHSHAKIKSVTAGAVVAVVTAVVAVVQTYTHGKASCASRGAGQYVLGALNSNTCPGASVAIQTEADCRSFASSPLAANKTFSGVITSNSTMRTSPRGCYRNVFFGASSAGNGSFYFNPSPTGGTSASKQPICLAVTGTPAPTIVGDTDPPTAALPTTAPPTGSPTASSTTAPTIVGDTNPPTTALPTMALSAAGVPAVLHTHTHDSRNGRLAHASRVRVVRRRATRRMLACASCVLTGTL